MKVFLQCSHILGFLLLPCLSQAQTVIRKGTMVAVRLITGEEKWGPLASDSPDAVSLGPWHAYDVPLPPIPRDQIREVVRVKGPKLHSGANLRVTLSDGRYFDGIFEPISHSRFKLNPSGEFSFGAVRDFKGRKARAGMRIKRDLKWTAAIVTAPIWLPLLLVAGVP